jgi:MFS family permease
MLVQSLGHVLTTFHRNGLNILPSFEGYFNITTTTMSLSTSATYIGGSLAGVTFPMFMNRVSRRSAMFWASALTLVFIVLQVTSVNIAMFIVARIGVGWGGGCSAIAAPAYVAETIPHKHRGWGLGLICDFYYVGEGFLETNTKELC